MKTAQHNPNKFGLAFKLAVLVIVSTSVIFAAAFAYNYWYSSHIVLDLVKQNAGNLTSSTVNRIETVLRGVEKLPLYLATHLENHELDEEAIKKCIAEMVSLNGDIFGSTVAYEPFAFNPASRFFAPYYYKENGQLIFRYLGSDSYDYYQWDWYLIPKELDAPA